MKAGGSRSAGGKNKLNTNIAEVILKTLDSLTNVEDAGRKQQPVRGEVKKLEYIPYAPVIPAKRSSNAGVGGGKPPPTQSLSSPPAMKENEGRGQQSESEGERNSRAREEERNNRAREKLQSEVKDSSGGRSSLKASLGSSTGEGGFMFTAPTPTQQSNRGNGTNVPDSILKTPGGEQRPLPTFAFTPAAPAVEERERVNTPANRGVRREDVMEEEEDGEFSFKEPEKVSEVGEDFGGSSPRFVFSPASKGKTLVKTPKKDRTPRKKIPGGKSREESQQREGGDKPFDFMPRSMTPEKVKKPVSKQAPTRLSAPAPATAAPPAGGGWGANMFRKDGEWKCGVCMCSNPKEANKCKSCEADRPGEGRGGGPAE